MSDTSDKIKASLDDYEEFDEYTKEQMVKIAEELNAMQLKYDTRLLAALMAGRAGLLHGMLVTSKVIDQSTARKIWVQAGVPIEELPEQETKVVKILDGEVLDPKDIN